MIDTRAVGQELQEQVFAAARKGHRRVTTTMKNVTATAQMIRPQLPALPTIDLAAVKLPTPDQLAKRTERQLSQLRKTAPGLIARIPNADYLARLTEKQIDQLRKTAPGLIARLPSPEHLRTGASELAGQVRSVQRQVTDQVRTVTTPLAEQAAAAFAQATSVTGATTKARPITHTPAQSHTSESTTAHASENGDNGSASASPKAATSHNGSSAPRKARSARSTQNKATPTRTTPNKAASARTSSAATANAKTTKAAKPASRRASTSKKAKPTSK
ncbi:MAG: hypothetical protein ACR2FU_24825 [Streptosporangiaceae bacterium]